MTIQFYFAIFVVLALFIVFVTLYKKKNSKLKKILLITVCAGALVYILFVILVAFIMSLSGNKTDNSEITFRNDLYGLNGANIDYCENDTVCESIIAILAELNSDYRIIIDEFSVLDTNVYYVEVMFKFTDNDYGDVKIVGNLEIESDRCQYESEFYDNLITEFSELLL